MKKANLRIQVESTQVERSTARLDELRKSGREAELSTGKLGKSSGITATSVLRMASAITGAVVGIQTFRKIISETVRVNSELEESLAGVRAVTQSTDSEMRKLAKTARELGSTTIYSASQSAEGMKFLGMAGFETGEIIEAMPGLLNLATSGMMDLGEAADIT